MKKKYKTRYVYTVPIYNQTIILLLCGWDKLPPDIRGEEGKTIGFCTRGEHPNGKKPLVIWVKDFEWTSDKIAILVHELSHATDEIAEWIGMKMDTEARAYLLEDLVRYFVSKIIVDIKKK